MLRARCAPLITLCLAAVLLAACADLRASPPLAVALPNGYAIERDHAGQLTLVDRRGKALVAPVAAYAVDRQIVSGLTGPAPNVGSAYPNDTPVPASPDPRYFVLDTSSGRLETGLMLDAWKARLGQLGETNAPDLHVVVLPSESSR